MSLAGIDISEYQTTTPSLANLDFVVCRATYGTKTDAMYARHSAAVRAAGLFLGAYHFAYTGSVVPIADQVAAFLAVAKGADFLAIDVEGTSQPTDAELRDLIGRIHAAGRTVGVYHSLSGFPTVGQDWNWVAYWGRQAPPIPWSFWQSSGSPLDHDWFNGDAAALGRLAGLTPPDSSTGDTMRTFTITGASGTATVSGTGHSAIPLDGSALVPLTAGQVLKNALPIHLDAPYDSRPGDRQSAYLVVVGGKDAAVLATDATFSSDRIAGYNDGRAAVISAAMNVPAAKG